MPAVAAAGGLPTRLGKYEILTPLAAGGMARIYVARTTGIGSFERHVVLKLITPERANDHTAVQMFLDEARLAASLNHQNVAQVFEVGEDLGIHYLAMEYVHGQDLRALLAKAGSQGTRVPLELALTVVAGAAAGLEHAHERRGPDGVPLGIVHRDVSPSNIMIGYDGSVKLLDFGIAKATARSVETQSGIIKGKFAYMAPEQCRGRDVDRRSDVFSLGIILYEVSTQHRCFRADSDFDTMHRIVTGDVVRPTRLVHGYPQALEAIVMKALAVDVSQRYQSAGQLLEAIESFAVASRMSLSTMSLGRFMRDMFGEHPEPWLTNRPSQQMPAQPRESTISNTNGTGSDLARTATPQPNTSLTLDPSSVDDEESGLHAQTILDPNAEDLIAADVGAAPWGAKPYEDPKAGAKIPPRLGTTPPGVGSAPSRPTPPAPAQRSLDARSLDPRPDTPARSSSMPPSTSSTQLTSTATEPFHSTTSPTTKLQLEPPTDASATNLSPAPPGPPMSEPSPGLPPTPSTPTLMATPSTLPTSITAPNGAGAAGVPMAGGPVSHVPSLPATSTHGSGTGLPHNAVMAGTGSQAIPMAAAGSQQVPSQVPHHFGSVPGSGSGPAHPALGSMPFAAAVPNELVYPRYEPPPVVEPSSELRLKPNRRPLIIGSIIIAIGLIIILAISFGGDDTPKRAFEPASDPGTSESGLASGSSAASDPGSAAQAVPDDGGAQVVATDATVVVDDEDDESISVKVDTEPPGANVMLAGKIIGTTPLETQVPRQATTAYLVVSRAEYVTEQREIDLRKDFTQKLVLKKTADTTKKDPPKADPGKKTTIKTPPKQDPIKTPLVKKDPPKKDPIKTPPKKDPPKLKCVKAGTQNPFEPQMCDGKPCPICPK